MGCSNTKPKSPVSTTCVNNESGPPKKDIRQTFPALDERQIFKLKQSWKGIRRNMDETGLEMFIRSVNNTL